MNGLTKSDDAISQALVGAHVERSGQAANRCEFTLLDGRIVESLGTPLDHKARLLVPTESKARNSCKALKRRKIDCMVIWMGPRS